MLLRERLLKQFRAGQARQVEIRGWVSEHRDRWLTLRRAAALEAAIFSVGFGFLLGALLFLL